MMSSIEHAVIGQHLRPLKMPGIHACYHRLTRQAADEAQCFRLVPV